MELHDGGEILLSADRMLCDDEILKFYGGWRPQPGTTDDAVPESDEIMLLALSPTMWKAAYAGSGIDSSPVAVNWWRKADGKMHVERS